MKENINETEITEYIRNHYEVKHLEICITERIIDRITRIVIEGLANALDNVSKDDALKSIESFLERGNVLEFISKRQPNTNPIPEDVIQTLHTYFERYLPNYELCHVYRKSNYQEDDYLYCVTARNAFNEKYACWSSWNTTIESLNQGHYNLNSEADGIHILIDLFDDVTDEPAKYGMLATSYEFPQDKNVYKEEKPVTDNIIEYQRHIRR